MLKPNEEVACDFPFSIKNPRYPENSNERYIPVPCGTCPECCKRRADSWIFRLLQQDKISSSALFVTLTYTTDYVPINRKGQMTLDKTHFQLFMKRLRKAQLKKHPQSDPLKYYAVGEYGSQFKRPHFHAIIFNADADLIPGAWVNPDLNESLGDVKIGNCSGASVAYTTKYIDKGRTIPQFKGDERIPEFSLMSKKLGLNYITPDTIRYHQEDINRNYITVEGGKKIALPRYFREKIYTEEQRHQQSQQVAYLSEQAELKRIEEFKNRTGNPDDYVRAKAEAKKQKIINYRENAVKKRK